MWPFYRKAAIPFAEYVKTLDPAPCGEQEEHYHWLIEVGRSCPICDFEREKMRKEVEQQKLATMIAEKVVEMMKGGVL